MKYRRCLIVIFVSLFLSIGLLGGCSGSHTPEDKDAPMSRQQAGERMRGIMGDPNGADPGPMSDGKGGIRPMATTGDGYCGGYKLCSEDSECANEANGNNKCCPCPACGKHCYNCGGGGGLPPPPPPPPVDAGTCEAGSPTYPPSNNTTDNLSFGFSLPDPAASFICGQLSAIPYVGQVLFTPTGGIGFNASVQTTSTDEWKDTCVHTTGKSRGAQITVNICSLEAAGGFNDDDKNIDYGCLDCGPPPKCNGIACTDKVNRFTANASLSKTFGISLGNVCTDSAGSSCTWLDWLKQHLNLSVTVGGGWTGTKTKTDRAPGGATCSTCTACKTEDVNNQVYLQASGRAALSSPSWGGVSGSVYAQLIGRLGAGRQDRTSTCAPACGGYNASGQVTLCLGYSATAWFWTVGSWIGWTCKWAKSWSDCAGAQDNDENGCRMANPTDGCGGG